MWNKIKVYSDREYLITAGTHGWAWVGNHAFVILKAMELPLDGPDKPKTRIVKMRNPWGRTTWKGAYGEGSAEYTKLQKYFETAGVKDQDVSKLKQGGRFFMTWDKLLESSSSFDVAFG